ncbi:hypothetical protein DEA8626_02938 [Defluviimonas aquaemixtae]|uniref:Uncharacterized protein n=1 Tax=Albidovulum aquaemixtae TaxID=1542388 RepID=A0A2R8BKE3_9RHOB|nr:hypothetical protein [Defluviimonas aquaemixtae]SPH23867.1 hypothetical protein DEA8626_02938 [Defluviimonas aquaemixtae]
MTRLTSSIRTAAGGWLATVNPPPRQLLSLAAERQAIPTMKKRSVPNPFAPRLR